MHFADGSYDFEQLLFIPHDRHLLPNTNLTYINWSDIVSLHVQQVFTSDQQIGCTAESSDLFMFRRSQGESPECSR